MTAGTLGAAAVSPWVALPLAAVALVLIAWHSTGLDRRAMPRSRRRIRQANSWVMMLGVPLFAAGASLISPQNSPRAFVLVWTGTAMLVILCVLLAIVDVLNTWRLVGHERREARAVERGMRAIAEARMRARGETDERAPESPHDD